MGAARWRSRGLAGLLWLVPVGAVFGAAGEDRVRVPAGRFRVGAGLVRGAAFTLDRTEVTVAAYAECVRAGRCSQPRPGPGCNWRWGPAPVVPRVSSGPLDRPPPLPPAFTDAPDRPRGEHPVNCVTWFQARRYCRWRGARLPTETEWERAARGLEGRTYPWGERGPSCRLAFMAEKPGGGGCGYGSTAPVGRRRLGASPFGALDMAGNVAEWTSSRHGARDRVHRGGSWASGGPDLKAARRRWMKASSASSEVGFRCAR